MANPPLSLPEYVIYSPYNPIDYPYVSVLEHYYMLILEYKGVGGGNGLEMGVT